MTAAPALEVQGLHVSIRDARIVRDVSWSVERGQTLGIVGESGSGKSMSVLAASGLMGSDRARVTGRSLLGPAADDDDAGPVDLLTMSAEQRRRVRGRRIGFVFQDPATSLNPLLDVERQLTEGTIEHLGLTRRAARTRALELLELVGIPDPERRLGAYPHQLSGGMRQRVMIAIALACDPDLLIADEATTALDVTIQAQILDAVRDLRERLGTAVVWISHDLAVVGSIADEVVVMYGGEIVEQSETVELFRSTAHPYTRGLFESRPRAGGDGSPLTTIPGAPPDPRAVPPGCVFWDRCSVRGDARCESEHPELREVSPGHLARSWYRADMGPIDGGGTARAESDLVEEDA
ncbi:ABC transporter ATP-binding protein [Georgenia sp. Z1344]|uniref:ABC transporter ATP-binding protein n=1 Tax=Georgenia sp. Z1344 TaxID=3416706 RepID=UPI003CEBFA07